MIKKKKLCYTYLFRKCTSTIWCVCAILYFLKKIFFQSSILKLSFIPTLFYIWKKKLMKKLHRLWKSKKNWRINWFLRANRLRSVKLLITLLYSLRNSRIQSRMMSKILNYSIKFFLHRLWSMCFILAIAKKTK